MRRRLAATITGACLATLGLFCAAGPASAMQYTPHALSSSFDGGDSGGFANAACGVAVDEATGVVYVSVCLGEEEGVQIHKFNANGVATPFSDPSLQGSSVVTLKPVSFGSGELTVDNSAGPHQGRIYVTAGRFGGGLFAFESSGKAVGGSFPIAGSANIAVSPTDGSIWAHNTGPTVTKYTSDGVGTTTTAVFPFAPILLAVSPEEDLYGYSEPPGPGIRKLDRDGNLLYTLPGSLVDFAVEKIGGNIFGVEFELGVEFDPEGDELPGFTFSGYPVGGVVANAQNGNLYVAFANQVQIFGPAPQVTLPDVKTTAPSEIDAGSGTLNGSIDPDGVETTSCQFLFGPTNSYGTTIPCAQGQKFSGSTDIPVSAHLTGLTQGSIYHYRLVVENANGALKTRDATFAPSAPPTIGGVYIDAVHSDSGVVHASINPGGAPTTFHVDYGTEDCLANPGACASTAETSSIGAGLRSVPVSAELTGLEADTAYHYVVVATNQSATVKSDDFRFTTFRLTEILTDECDNAHVRQQTGAALLPDCRAYELVSAADTGGYDVESYLTSLQTPFGSYPRATSPSRVLYGVHEGAIPGTNHPTNHGLDPYVATRGDGGWSTEYVGIPANLSGTQSFASTLAAADAGLDTFAFGGPDICSPCFADGSTGVPVRRADGSLVQGMTGPVGAAAPAGAEMLVEKPLSADGRHLVFGSSTAFVEGAGSPAIYDRDLGAGTTHDVSRLPDGNPIPCLMRCDSDGLAELDISADGSRIVIGQLVAVDSAGNDHWHLFMNVGDSSKSIDLMPNGDSGALYDGMSADGSIVYLTSPDQLTADDTDAGADIYRADATADAASLTRVSAGSGGAGNDDGCDPPGNTTNDHWNVPDGVAADCGAVAIGGGGGVAAGSGAIYFLSPDLLDGPGNGSQDAPNLYLARSGSAPHFVTTLESDLTSPAEPLTIHPYSHSFTAGPTPQFVAADASGGPSNGDVYVADNGSHVVRKFDAGGNLITSWGENGVLDGSSTSGVGSFPSIAGLAVGTDGTLYVACKVKNENADDLFKFAEDGTFESEANVYGRIGAVGVAVDAVGNLYYVEETEGFGGGQESVVRRYDGSFEATPVSSSVFKSGHKNGLAIDPGSGDLYVNFGNDRIGRFSFDSSGRVLEPDGSVCERGCEPTGVFGIGAIFGASGLAVDPSNGDVYVDEGNRILRYDSTGRRVVGPDTGADVLSNSTSVAIGPDTTLYANNATSTGTSVAVFSALVPGPDPRVDNPAIVDAVNDAGSRHTADFQVTESGDDAAFSSTIPFSGYDNDGHAEVFRYHAPTSALDCASCNPTNARAVSDGEMAADGLSLTDDGRVFFTTTEPLAPRDLDNKRDVYEWEPGAGVSLISTGISQFDSILLGAGADGTDAYFFTRDSLVPQDTNGPLVKIYDARAQGGFPYASPEVPCKASDECHGAGTQLPSAADINSGNGSGGNLGVVGGAKGVHCKRGFVKRHGKCVKRKVRHRSQRRHNSRRGGKR